MSEFLWVVKKYSEGESYKLKHVLVGYSGEGAGFQGK